MKDFFLDLKKTTCLLWFANLFVMTSGIFSSDFHQLGPLGPFFFSFFFKEKSRNLKISFIMQPLHNCIDPTIRIGQESWCLPNAEFFVIVFGFILDYYLLNVFFFSY